MHNDPKNLIRLANQVLVLPTLGRALTIAIVALFVLAASASARADWADQLGEGSGVDRVVALTAPTTAPSGPTAILQSAETGALRDSIAGSITKDMAGSFGGSFTPAAFTSAMPSVPSIPAENPNGRGNGGL